MSSLRPTLRQLKAEKEEIDEAIAVLERLSLQLEKARKTAESVAKPSTVGAGSETEKGTKR